MTEAYDEFGLFQDNAEEVGLAWSGPPTVERVSVPVDGERRVSALRWGTGPPEIVFIHGGAQNAHTWDTVALALDRPLLAVDLPGHGHSDWREDHSYWPPHLADDVAVVVRELAPTAELVVGMSLGGLTAICLAAQHPELVRRLAIVDVTPGVDHAKAEPIVTFVSGPETFASFQEILDRTVEFNPTRSVSSLRRGILHNAKENPDGSWTWRWDAMREWNFPEGEMPDFDSLWEKVDQITAPILFLRGGAAGSVVGDEDQAELVRRQPTTQVEVVADAGHSLQGDQPLELARLLSQFATLLTRPPRSGLRSSAYDRQIRGQNERLLVLASDPPPITGGSGARTDGAEAGDGALRVEPDLVVRESLDAVTGSRQRLGADEVVGLVDEGTVTEGAVDLDDQHSLGADEVDSAQPLTVEEVALAFEVVEAGLPSQFLEAVLEVRVIRPVVGSALGQQLAHERDAFSPSLGQVVEHQRRARVGEEVRGPGPVEGLGRQPWLGGGEVEGDT